MNQRSEHLSDAQIQRYGKRASGAGPETEAWVETHLDDCPSCRSRVLEFQRTRFALLPDPKVNTVSSSNCPSEEDLRNLAAGLCSGPLSAELTAHAAACGRCGPLLRQYQEDFSDDVTPEEQTALAQLRSASPAWRQQKAREMLQQVREAELVPATDWRRFFSWKWVMVPATATVAFIAVGLLYLQRDTPEKAEKYLAQAYKEKRTIEMRWPGAKWGERAETLGPVHGNKPEPTSFLRAEAAIAAIRRQAPETLKNGEWLHVRAQKELLSGIESEPGRRAELEGLQQLIDDLNKATQSQPASQSLLFDLAIANFRMGEMTQDTHYYEESKAILDKMLASSRSSAALFDRAVVAQRLFERAVGDERLQLRNNAIADLEECLNSEKDQEWREEIRQKIQDWKTSSDR